VSVCENDSNRGEPAFLQPVAVHGADATRMIARDPDGGWWLWNGGAPAGSRALEAIPAALATWMMQRPELWALGQPRFWFPPDALPMRAGIDAAVPPGNGD
jgi:hypothetical protein